MHSFPILILALAAAADGSRAVDTQRSTIAIHVGKSGLLASAGHDHIINAPVASGSIHDSAPEHVEFTVHSAQMTVQPDPKVDARTQATIQQNMQETTLESNRFPEIAFRSIRIARQQSGDWKVEGELSLHGVTKPVTAIVKREGDAWVSHTTLHQTDFGIKPVSAGGGLVKVKNEIDLDFRIFTAPE